MKKIIGITSMIVILDQMIKYEFTKNMVMGETISIIPHFFSLTLVQNTGVAFSLFSGNQIPLILLSIIAIFLLFWYLNKQKLNKYSPILYGFLFGGILGNLIDRICRNGVIDYLDFQILGYDAPIFNLADICVVLSAFALMIIVWKEDKNAKL